MYKSFLESNFLTASFIISSKLNSGFVKASTSLTKLFVIFSTSSNHTFSLEYLFLNACTFEFHFQKFIIKLFMLESFFSQDSASIFRSLLIDNKFTKTSDASL